MYIMLCSSATIGRKKLACIAHDIITKQSTFFIIQPFSQQPVPQYTYTTLNFCYRIDIVSTRTIWILKHKFRAVQIVENWLCTWNHWSQVIIGTCYSLHAFWHNTCYVQRCVVLHSRVLHAHIPLITCYIPKNIKVTSDFIVIVV